MNRMIWQNKPPKVTLDALPATSTFKVETTNPAVSGRFLYKLDSSRDDKGRCKCVNLEDGKPYALDGSHVVYEIDRLQIVYV